MTNSTLSHTASVYTQNTYTQCFYTWQAFTHTETFTQRRFYTQQTSTHKIFYTQQAFTHSKRLHTEHLHTVLLHMPSVYTHKLLHTGIAAPKPELDATTVKIRISSTFRRILKGKLLAPKLRKSADKSLSQPGCSHSNTIYDLQLQMTIPEHRI